MFRYIYIYICYLHSPAFNDWGNPPGLAQTAPIIAEMSSGVGWLQHIQHGIWKVNARSQSYLFFFLYLFILYKLFWWSTSIPALRLNDPDKLWDWTMIKPLIVSVLSKSQCQSHMLESVNLWASARSQFSVWWVSIWRFSLCETCLNWHVCRCRSSFLVKPPWWNHLGLLPCQRTSIMRGIWMKRCMQRALLERSTWLKTTATWRS